MTVSAFQGAKNDGAITISGVDGHKPVDDSPP